MPHNENEPQAGGPLVDAELGQNLPDIGGSKAGDVECPSCGARLSLTESVESAMQPNQPLSGGPEMAMERSLRKGF